MAWIALANPRPLNLHERGKMVPEGRAEVGQASRGGEAEQGKEGREPAPGAGERWEMEAIATAYSYTGNWTATGTWPRCGTVAVDPRVIPLGSRLWVEGYGPGRAEDTGYLIKGRRIDMFLPSRAEAREWGRKRVRVVVWHGGKGETGGGQP